MDAMEVRTASSDAEDEDLDGTSSTSSDELPFVVSDNVNVEDGEAGNDILDTIDEVIFYQDARCTYC
jgi:hypothetical protein